MGNQNRKAAKWEMERIREVIKDAYPDLTPVFGGHGDYGGHRAPRDHTLSFRLRDTRGQFVSNVVWIMPEWLTAMTATYIRKRVEHANGKRTKKQSG